MRIRDCSSDVCSSDLHAPAVVFAALLQTLTRFPRLGSCTVKVSCDERFQRTAFYRRGHPMGGALVLSIRQEWKSVVEGRGVSDSVDLGGRGIVKQKSETETPNTNLKCDRNIKN